MSEWIDDRKLAVVPGQLGCTVYALDLTAGDAQISLPPGGYVLSINGTNRAVVRLGAAASVPASGASLGDACHLDPGVPRGLRLDATTAVHAILTGGTATLIATRYP